MNRNNEVSLVAADAFVMHYDSILVKWVASGASKSVTIAKVQLLQNVTSNQFRIYAWNPINKEILLNSVLYHNLRYQKAHATFHEWRDADTQLVYGLHFADTEDASTFGNVISRVFKSLELIYQQCRELQYQIRATSTNAQYKQSLINAEPAKLTCTNTLLAKQISDSSIKEYSTDNSLNYNFNKENQSCNSKDKSDSKTTAKPPPSKWPEKCYASIYYSPDVDFTNNGLELQSPHDYENIDNIFAQYLVMESSGREHVELSSKCQSSSDDSVRGLKKQPSSNSSGYATVASLTDALSGVTSSFQVTGETHNKCITESKPKNQTCTYNSIGLESQTDSVQAESVSSSFTSQLQSMIQLRKSKQSSRCNDSSIHISFPQHNSKYHLNLRASEGMPEGLSKDLHTVPTDDIMSEMKMKLQRRKQLIDGHTDPNYSSSTDKSDACSSNDEEKSNQILEDQKDSSHYKQRSFGDTIHNSQTTAIFASKHDLDGIKRDIIDNFRKEFMEIKKEVLEIIRLLKSVS